MPAEIMKLKIDRFRGIEHLEWRPKPGVNVILGGGDTGKTTILEAIALLFHPINTGGISETDYWNKVIEEPFVIEAVVFLPEDVGVNTQSALALPWHWNGSDAVIPEMPENGVEEPVAGNPVYCWRVTGTPDLELIWEIVQPNEETSRLSSGLRRQVGLVRLSAEDHNDRDLRLVYGSALDRLFGDTALRSRIQTAIAGIDLDGTLGEDGTEKLDAVDNRMKAAALPDDLSIGLASSRGVSIGALISVLARKGGISLPLTSWGAGTKRMAALEIAAATESDPSFTIIDEVERGLEPYRLRKLIAGIQGSQRQSFLTTHSAVAISAALDSDLWYLDSAGHLGHLPSDMIKVQQERDPETFLAKVAVIAEGRTEVGFLQHLLFRALNADPLDLGIRVSEGQGNRQTLDLLSALTSSGLLFAGLADNEGDNPVRWAGLKETMGATLLQWVEGCTEEAVITQIPDERLDEIIGGVDHERRGDRLRTLADRVGIIERDLQSINSALELMGKDIRTLIIEAASGSRDGAPEGDNGKWKSHGRVWFKSVEGGRELANQMIALGAWPALRPTVLPLLNAILSSVDIEPIDDLNP